jgi:hypothetical protein
MMRLAMFEKSFDEMARAHLRGVIVVADLGRSRAMSPVIDSVCQVVRQSSAASGRMRVLRRAVRAGS